MTAVDGGTCVTPMTSTRRNGSGSGPPPRRPRHTSASRKRVAAALLDGWDGHTSRHRFAARAYRATSDLGAAPELLGHPSPVNTSVYTAAGNDTLRRAAAAAVL